jgi:hypothetical protein
VDSYQLNEKPLVHARGFFMSSYNPNTHTREVVKMNYREFMANRVLKLRENDICPRELMQASLDKAFDDYDKVLAEHERKKSDMIHERSRAYAYDVRDDMVYNERILEHYARTVKAY